MIEGTVTSEVVIACIDAFIRRLREGDLPRLPVVLVLDNASIHNSEEFLENLHRWAAQGVTLRFLPRYCPELNMIEILWRRIKYHWLPLDATQSWEKLCASVEYVLKGIGTEYQITFA